MGHKMGLLDNTETDLTADFKVEQSDTRGPSLDDLYSAWSTGKKPEQFKALLDATAPIRTSAIKSYFGRPDPLATSRAKLLTAQALQKYDPKVLHNGQPIKLRTWTMIQLQPLRRLGARRDLIRIPEQARLQLNALTNAQTELEYELDRPATIAELSDRTGLPSKRIQYIQALHRNPTAESARVGESGEPLLDKAGGISPRAQEVLHYIYLDSSPIDRKIMEWRTGYGGVKMLPTGDIANKLGVSAGAISQRANKLAEKIRESMRGV